MRLVILNFLFFYSLTGTFAQYTYDYNYTYGTRQSTIMEIQRFALPRAMGGNYTGYAEGPEAQYYNPAGMAFSKGFSLLPGTFYRAKSVYSSPDENKVLGQFFSGVFSGSKIGAIGIGYFSQREYYGLGETYINNQQISLDYARKILPWLSVGVTGSYFITSDQYNYIYDKNIPYSFGISGLAKWKKGKNQVFGVGLNVKNPVPYTSNNLNTKIRDDYNPVIALGFSYKLSYTDTNATGLKRVPVSILTNVDYRQIIYDIKDYDDTYTFNSNNIKTGVGTMITVYSLLDVMAGFNYYLNLPNSIAADHKSSAMGLNFGVGVNLKNSFFNRKADRWQISLHACFNEHLLYYHTASLNQSYKYYINPFINTLSVKFEYFFKK